MPPKLPPLNLERFFSHTEKEGDCVVWKSFKTPSGYGTIRVDGWSQRAHRIAYELFNGAGSTTGLCVLHRCDNRACVNPSHLFLGTSTDNTADMVAKGRQHKGPGTGRNKLSEKDVFEIRMKYRKGSRDANQMALGRAYGVHRSVISQIHTGATWRYLA